MHLSQLSNVFVPNCKIYSSKFENAKPDRKPTRDQVAIRAAAKMGFSDKGFRASNSAHFCRAKNGFRASNPICKLLTTSWAKNLVIFDWPKRNKTHYKCKTEDFEGLKLGFCHFTDLHKEFVVLEAWTSLTIKRCLWKILYIIVIKDNFSVMDAGHHICHKR